jgi:leucyl-tRNA synthetase
VVRKVHATVKRATDAMEKDFGFNTAVAACMELTNELKPTLQPAVLKLGIDTLVRLLAPMAPHICEELWADLGHTGDVTAAGWPAYDEAEIAGDSAEYPVQVNGKVRGRITLSRALTGAALEAAVLAHETVKTAIDGKPVKKLVVVPGKIVNIVVG